MGKTERVGFEDWDKIVKLKEESLVSIKANERNLEVGRIVEEASLKQARKERDKYSEPKSETMEETEKPAETEEAPAE